MQLLQTDYKNLDINIKTGFVLLQTGFVLLQTGFVLLQTGFEIKIKIGVSVGCHIFM